MAEDEAEKAFFQAQSLNADIASYEAAGDQDGDSSDSDDYDPSKTVQNHQDQYSAQLTDSKPSAVSNTSSLSASLKRRSMSQDFSEAVQNSHTFPPSQIPSGSEPGDPTPLPPSNTSAPVQVSSQSIGNFVVGEDSDEDRGEAEYEPPAALSHVHGGDGGDDGNEGNDDDNVASDPSGSRQHSLSQNANENVSQYHVSHQLQTVQDKNSPPQDVPPPNSSSLPPSYVGLSAPSDGASNYLQDDSKPPTVTTGDTASQPANRSISSTPTAAAAPRGRLPHDRVGILEDRIQADPRGDTDAWLELINEHRSRNKLDSAREVYERFFKIFPSAAEQWVAYANMESENNELYRLEQIFNKSLLSIPNVQLWSVYLDYVRRRNNLTTDTTGQARGIISSAYDFALQNIGVDKDSANIWVDYIQFIRSGPGNIGGSGWQDQQKMDLLRKAYQRAICVPTQAVNTLWKEYDQFEMGLNKLTGRKFLQERSPAYMTARSSFTELQNITRELVRASLPRLPPAPGCEGEEMYNKQVEIWKRWIKWEKDDPLVLRDEDGGAGYKARVLYVYRQSLMALRFLPEIWFDAADFCFQNEMESEGNDFLKQGIDANPESCLLAFKLADRIEVTTESEQDSRKRGAKAREPYDRLLDALYDLISKAKAQEAKDIAFVEESFSSQAESSRRHVMVVTNEEDEDEGDDAAKAREAAKNSQIEALKKKHAEAIGQLSKTISFAWIALMRSMRRIQGKGKPGEMAGSRQIFADARKRGRITSDVYIASALLEHYCYKDPAATKIFERGAKLFPEDENFTLEYLKHLIDINDITNARAVFEMSVRRLAANPNNTHKAKPIFAFMHEHESRYGDMVQILNLEARMRELFPEDPVLKQFLHRFSTPAFDPTAFQPILSPSQTKPKLASFTATEEMRPCQGSPSTRYPQGSGPAPPTTATHSPKRPYAPEEFDDDASNRPRKFMRAESPLKGAAGRRLNQQKQQIQQQVVNGGGVGGGGGGGMGGGYGGGAGGGQGNKPPIPIPLPREIMFLLSIIPGASTYDATRFSPEKMVALLRQLDVPSSVSQLRPPVPPPGGGGVGGMAGGMNRGQYMGMYRPGS
ncbi:mRNA 3'-end-processing protein rna14 [Blastomyces gilchristii SLH14081]|uniref:mRNA 3'-end-processing protein RNA14 n=1 Tax=Blastomyces gilchristii (strain SLH14081) TaxID=559298 RepID=A0A179UH27_BLAGS|nr:mRNA 3'-end-processing protein rna14 [Blastomyces gilchristii SLH14081]OAT07053.1 mRNA 3'-end-processing protein rna14 [Blastomyces gilchristii SLH14081]